MVNLSQEKNCSRIVQEIVSDFPGKFLFPPKVNRNTYESSPEKNLEVNDYG